MVFAWKAAGLTYNRYLAVAARVVRRSLKEDKRVAAERRGEMDLRFAKWSNGKQGEVKNLADAQAAAAVEAASCKAHMAHHTPAGVVSPEQNTFLAGKGPSNISQTFSDLSLEPNGGTEPPPLLAPQIKSAGVVTRDITEDFKRATKGEQVSSRSVLPPQEVNIVAELAPGELVKDGFFTLFESVGALEIMDPKMDSGCLAPGESLYDEYDLARTLSPEQVMGIIDQLLCSEMAWHLGYPLSQTIFTNVYIEAILMPCPIRIQDADFIRDRDDSTPTSPMHAVLRAYCLGLLKSCFFVIKSINSELYYEEEDFVTNTYHRSLLESINRQEIVDVIQDTRALLRTMRQSWSEDLVLALDSRLELREAFLTALQLVDGDTIPDSLKTTWERLGEILSNVTKTHSLAVPVPESFSKKIQRRLASTMPPRPIVQPSFDEACAHWKRMFEDGAEVHDVLKYTDSQTLLNFVLAFQSKKPQPLVFVRTLLQSYIFRDNIILRSMSIRQLMDDDLATVVLPASPLLDPANDAVEAVHHPRFVVANQMEEFRQRAAAAYLDVFRFLCQNRPRIRRTLCHALNQWEMVQVEAEDTDQVLQAQVADPAFSSTGGSSQTTAISKESLDALPLSSWSYLYKLRIMEWIVQLGFELQTYQPDELAGMYWYLSYLAKRRLQHLERIKSFTVQAFDASSSPPSQGGDRDDETHSAFARSLSYLRAAMLDAASTWQLADALSCLYTVLYRPLSTPTPPSCPPQSSEPAGFAALARPHRPYSTDALRYDVRMKPFAAVGLPELPDHAAFARETDQPGVPTADVLAYAERAASGARRGFEALARLEAGDAFSSFSGSGAGGGGGGGGAGSLRERWLDGQRSCVKAAILTGIGIGTLQKVLDKTTAAGGGSGGGEEPDLKGKVKAEVPAPDQGYHEWWVVPKVTALS
ncbi:uncharacterized protein E0L32_008467 [Thyridium curvatum]|uniref:Uncharacterized protein n=1 Tax=Thyridium curvatum TaxID=1093900 RepID=A0A507B0E1_9PEZI|nr:uncharacterized protein E0L32_008467 [Thyridium curvatum]TPX10581.1 hypothetical protein E0L32_008467 [Thyridium curvatum]